MTLFESQRRHADVAERLRVAAGLRNADVVNDRVESASLRESFDVVTARAVASLAVLVEYAAPLLADGGQLVAWKGARDAAEELGGEEAGRIVGLSLDRVERGRAVPRRALAPPALLRQDRARRPTASPAGPAWPASARSPEGGGDGSVPNCYGMPPDSDRLRH